MGSDEPNSFVLITCNVFSLSRLCTPQVFSFTSEKGLSAEVPMAKYQGKVMVSESPC